MSVPLPEREPDTVCDLPTIAQQALYYRLNGDPDPHNADPKMAVAAGLPRPILQALCPYGFAGLALVRALCDYDASRLKSLHVRLSAPVFPGETLRTEIWRENSARAAFRMTAVERNQVVLNNGLAELA